MVDQSSPSVDRVKNNVKQEDCKIMSVSEKMEKVNQFTANSLKRLKYSAAGCFLRYSVIGLGLGIGLGLILRSHRLNVLNPRRVDFYKTCDSPIHNENENIPKALKT